MQQTTVARDNRRERQIVIARFQPGKHGLETQQTLEWNAIPQRPLQLLAQHQAFQRRLAVHLGPQILLGEQDRPPGNPPQRQHQRQRAHHHQPPQAARGALTGHPDPPVLHPGRTCRSPVFRPDRCQWRCLTGQQRFARQPVSRQHVPLVLGERPPLVQGEGRRHTVFQTVHIVEQAPEQALALAHLPEQQTPHRQQGQHAPCRRAPERRSGTRHQGMLGAGIQRQAQCPGTLAEAVEQRHTRLHVRLRVLNRTSRRQRCKRLRPARLRTCGTRQQPPVAGKHLQRHQIRVHLQPALQHQRQAFHVRQPQPQVKPAQQLPLNLDQHHLQTLAEQAVHRLLEAQHVQDRRQRQRRSQRHGQRPSDLCG